MRISAIGVLIAVTVTDTRAHTIQHEQHEERQNTRTHTHTVISALIALAQNAKPHDCAQDHVDSGALTMPVI